MHDLEDRTDTIMAQLLGQDMQGATLRLAAAVAILSAIVALVVVLVASAMSRSPKTT